MELVPTQNDWYRGMYSVIASFTHCPPLLPAHHKGRERCSGNWLSGLRGSVGTWAGAATTIAERASTAFTPLMSPSGTRTLERRCEFTLLVQSQRRAQPLGDKAIRMFGAISISEGRIRSAQIAWRSRKEVEFFLDGLSDDLVW